MDVLTEQLTMDCLTITIQKTINYTFVVKSCFKKLTKTHSEFGSFAEALAMSDEITLKSKLPWNRVLVVGKINQRMCC